MHGSATPVHGMSNVLEKENTDADEASSHHLHATSGLGRIYCIMGLRELILLN